MSNAAAPTQSTGSGSSQAIPQLDCNDPLFLQYSDTPGTALVSQLLTETENYSEWSRSMLMSLLVKNKVGFIDGSCKRDAYLQDNFRLHQWDRCNTIVQSWIMSSVTQELRKGIVYSKSAQKVWEAFKERFDRVNATKIFQLHKEICLIDQGIQSISVYFSKLNDLWTEFESSVPFPGCDCTRSRSFTAFMHQQKFMTFLMGLNETYTPQRSQILMMIPTPTLDQAYSMLIQEESQRSSNGGVNQGGILGATPAPVEGTLAPTITANAANTRFRKGTNSDIRCDYCKMRGHTKDKCYKLIGYPPRFKFSNNRRKGFGDQSSAHYAMDREFIKRDGGAVPII